MVDEGVHLFAELVDLADELDHPDMKLFLVLGLKFLEIIIPRVHDLVDADLSFPQLVTQITHILKRERQVVENLSSLALALLDPLRDRYFSFLGKERHRAHLFEVKTNRIVGLADADLNFLLFRFLLHGFFEVHLIGLDTLLQVLIRRLACLSVMPRVGNVHIQVALAEQGNNVVELFR